MLSLMSLKSLPRLEITNVDKIFHTCAYFGLVVIWYLQYFANAAGTEWRARSLLFIGFFATVFGILIEVLQGTLTSYRNWDMYDMLANLTGVVLALILLFLLRNTLVNVKMKI